MRMKLRSICYSFSLFMYTTLQSFFPLLSAFPGLKCKMGVHQKEHMHSWIRHITAMQAPSLQKFLSDSRERYSFQLLLKIERSLTFFFCPKKRKRFHFSVAVCNILAKNDCFIGLMLQQPGAARTDGNHIGWMRNPLPSCAGWRRRPRKVAALLKPFLLFFHTIWLGCSCRKTQKRSRPVVHQLRNCCCLPQRFLFEGLFASFSRTKADLTLKIFLLLHFKLFYLHTAFKLTWWTFTIL